MTKLASFASLMLAAGCVDAPDDGIDVDSVDRTTSPAALPNRIALAHLDDAVGTSLLQYDQHRLFVTRTDFAGTPVLHHYFDTNIVSLVVGDFALPGSTEHGHDQVCAILTSGTLECRAPTADRSALRLWFAQQNPLQPGEQAIVGDFTGDGAADILAYSPALGAVRLLDRSINGVFMPSTAFTPGSLASIDLHGKQLYAGEFGGTVGRADLVVVDPATGTVRRYDTTTDASGRTTFASVFATTAGTLVANEQVTVANIEGGSRDGLLLRDPATGRIRAMRADYASGGLADIPATAVSLGQIPVTTHSGQLAAVKIKTNTSEPGTARDDTLFFDRTSGSLVETSARYDGTRYTYWWAWTKAIPTQTGWAAHQHAKVAVIYCKLADVDRTLDQSSLARPLIGKDTGGVRDFIFQTTYGTLDIADADTFGWVTSSLNAADSSARIGQAKGYETGQVIQSCEQAAGVNGADYGGHVLVVLNDTQVAFQGINNYGCAIDYARLLDGKIAAVAHEVLHAFGLNHANDDSGRDCGSGSPTGEYCDTFDVMGNFYGTYITQADGSTTGPELNAPHRADLGAIPASRMLVLDPSAPASTTITLAPVEQPEAGGTLMVKLVLSPTLSYTIEYRRPVLLDARIAVEGVQVHLVDDGNSPGATRLLASPNTLAAGTTKDLLGYTVHVDSVDPATHRAVIRVTR